jgi:hypothetical protein
MKINLGDAVFWAAVFALIVLCRGEPDILDGLIKRANTVECTK